MPANPYACHNYSLQLNDEYRRMGPRLGIPLVATNDVRHATPETVNIKTVALTETGANFGSLAIVLGYGPEDAVKVSTSERSAPASQDRWRLRQSAGELRDLEEADRRAGFLWRASAGSRQARRRLPLQRG